MADSNLFVGIDVSSASLDLCSSNDETIRSFSNDAVGITALIDLLKNDPHREARRSAAASLGKIGPPAKAAIAALSAALKEDGRGGWWVRVCHRRRCKTRLTSRPAGYYTQQGWEAWVPCGVRPGDL